MSCQWYAPVRPQELQAQLLQTRTQLDETEQARDAIALRLAESEGSRMLMEQQLLKASGISTAGCFLQTYLLLGILSSHRQCVCDVHDG